LEALWTVEGKKDLQIDNSRQRNANAHGATGKGHERLSLKILDDLFISKGLVFKACLFGRVVGFLSLFSSSYCYGLRGCILKSQLYFTAFISLTINFFPTVSVSS